MPITANLDKMLDKAYEGSTLAEILAAPVSAIAGVSDGDGELLAKAIGIKTVDDLGKNKFSNFAKALHELAS